MQHRKWNYGWFGRYNKCYVKNYNDFRKGDLVEIDCDKCNSERKESQKSETIYQEETQTEQKDQKVPTLTDEIVTTISKMCNMITKLKTQNVKSDAINYYQQQVKKLISQYESGFPKNQEKLYNLENVFKSVENGNSAVIRELGVTLQTALEYLDTELTNPQKQLIKLIISEEFLKAIEPFNPSKKEEKQLVPNVEANKNNMANEIIDSWDDTGNIDEVIEKINKVKDNGQYKTQKEKIEKLLGNLKELKTQKERFLKVIEDQIKRWEKKHPKVKTEIEQVKDPSSLKESIYDELGLS